MSATRPTAEDLLRTERLTLTPIRPGDAREMAEVLSDPELYRFTGDEPPTLPELETRYHTQVQGPSNPDERWCNWIIRDAATGVAIGYVQATIDDGRSADVAWVVGSDHQGRGIATEAAIAMVEWLLRSGVSALSAHIHSANTTSQRVASKLGLADTGQLDHDGEELWRAELRCTTPET